ncbi:Acetyltransferase [Sporomusa silvacetica DSM 10669]|uniref:Acetyltransferase n=1 Tax=Sporomusa silvacetica DSM 10669 TaxID=1123289 RepID=A0ABZ3IHA4_9FIRM|nr:GNAT family N-acetyltransferase [Sporomusa silvacetica]OZC14886.1 acetyltransferase (GNAT) family protein [Sporomusa silvacetica DSM 10669]
MPDKQYKDKQIAISESDGESALYIRQQLVKYNLQKVLLEGKLTIEPLNFILKNTDGNIVGGINANIIAYLRKCRVDIFWIDEQYRGRGYGSKLLGKVEEFAMASGCTLIQLDTYSFQAPKFYIKQGYELFGVIEDCPPGHSHYFFKKTL